MLRGLPELTNLLLKDNDISDITLPSDPKILSKLRKLDLGYNRITSLRDELDGLVSLSHLLLEHNFFSVVPMRVCLMKSLRELNVGNNESIHQPPMHDCERGLCAMRRYWECLRREEESKREVEANLRRRASKAALAKSTSLPPKISIHENQNEVHVTLTERFSTTGSSVTASSCSSPKPAAKSPFAGRSESSPIPSLITTPKAHDTINDTLKVIVVGMEFAGKTSIIKKLIEGKTAEIPGPDKRTVGLDIYDWYPKTDKRFEDIDSRIETTELVECGDVNVKFSVWDFAGAYCATLRIVAMLAHPSNLKQGNMCTMLHTNYSFPSMVSMFVCRMTRCLTFAYNCSFVYHCMGHGTWKPRHLCTGTFKGP